MYAVSHLLQVFLSIPALEKGSEYERLTAIVADVVADKATTAAARDNIVRCTIRARRERKKERERQRDREKERYVMRSGGMKYDRNASSA